MSPKFIQRNSTGSRGVLSNPVGSSIGSGLLNVADSMTDMGKALKKREADLLKLQQKAESDEEDIRQQRQVADARAPYEFGIQKMYQELINGATTPEDFSNLHSEFIKQSGELMEKSTEGMTTEQKISFSSKTIQQRTNLASRILGSSVRGEEDAYKDKISSEANLIFEQGRGLGVMESLEKLKDSYSDIEGIKREVINNVVDPIIRRNMDNIFYDIDKSDDSIAILEDQSTIEYLIDNGIYTQKELNGINKDINDRKLTNIDLANIDASNKMQPLVSKIISMINEGSSIGEIKSLINNKELTLTELNSLKDSLSKAGIDIDEEESITEEREERYKEEIKPFYNSLMKLSDSGAENEKIWSIIYNDTTLTGAQKEALEKAVEKHIPRPETPSSGISPSTYQLQQQDKRAINGLENKYNKVFRRLRGKFVNGKTIRIAGLSDLTSSFNEFKSKFEQASDYSASYKRSMTLQINEFEIRLLIARDNTKIGAENAGFFQNEEEHNKKRVTPRVVKIHSNILNDITATSKYNSLSWEARKSMASTFFTKYSEYMESKKDKSDLEPSEADAIAIVNGMLEESKMVLNENEMTDLNDSSKNQSMVDLTDLNKINDLATRFADIGKTSAEEILFANTISNKFGVRPEYILSVINDAKESNKQETNSLDALEREMNNLKPKEDNNLKAQEMRPVAMDNDDGTVSSHLMTSTGPESTRGNYAFPTIFPKDPQNPTRNPKDWIVAKNDDEAFKIAKERDELMEFPTFKEADKFAKGSWKKGVEEEVENNPLELLDSTVRDLRKVDDAKFKADVTVNDIPPSGTLASKPHDGGGGAKLDTKSIDEMLKNRPKKSIKKVENKVDYSFIEKLEGNKTTGYVPSNNSGVTIASGFDLKERTYESLIKDGMSKELAEKLKPYTGVSGTDAKKIAKNLKITKDEQKIINEIGHSSSARDVVNQYKKATGKNFNDLTIAQQTVVMSVGYQYGRFSRTPKFWEAVKKGDWDAVIKELENFGDDFPTRRKKEAGLLKKESKKPKSGKEPKKPKDSKPNSILDGTKELIELEPWMKDGKKGKDSNLPKASKEPRTPK